MFFQDQIFLHAVHIHNVCGQSVLLMQFLMIVLSNNAPIVYY